MNDSAIPPGFRRCNGPLCRGQVKPLDQFHRHAGKLEGREYRCRVCSNSPGWQPPEPTPPGRKRCTGLCGQVKALNQFRRGRQPCTDCERTHQAATRAATRAANRAAVLAYYGTACACCGATERLTIDHLDGDGAEHRAALRIRTGSRFYAWLVRQGFPPGYQTLCYRCNPSKGGGSACRLDHTQAKRGYRRRRSFVSAGGSHVVIALFVPGPPPSVPSVSVS